MSIYLSWQSDSDRIHPELPAGSFILQILHFISRHGKFYEWYENCTLQGYYVLSEYFGTNEEEEENTFNNILQNY